MSKLQARNVQYDIVRIGNVKVDRRFLIFLKVSPWCWLVVVVCKYFTSSSWEVRSAVSELVVVTWSPVPLSPATLLQHSQQQFLKTCLFCKHQHGRGDDSNGSWLYQDSKDSPSALISSSSALETVETVIIMLGAVSCSETSHWHS